MDLKTTKVRWEELQRAEDWCRRVMETGSGPISLTYDGNSLEAWLPTMKISNSREELGKGIVFVKRLEELKSGLVLRCEATVYKDFPVVEWVATLENTGNAPTAILEHILAMDLPLGLDAKACVIHHQKGSHNEKNDFENYETVLNPGQSFYKTPIGGRSTNNAYPYFYLQGENLGYILALGWLGQWSVDMTIEGQSLRIRAGQQKTHLRLLPGEQIRTPRVVLEFCDCPAKGEENEFRARNIFRRWMRAYNMPRSHGQVPECHLGACSSQQCQEMINANEKNQKEFIDRYVEENLGIDHWWMDAGWYPCDGNWTKTGTWEPDKIRFPHGLRAVSDYGREKNIGTILWFEPERVALDTEIAREHPQWLLTPPQNPGGMDYSTEHRAFDFGIPEARDWMIEKVASILVKEGVDFYRQDFNQDPLLFWRVNEGEDRQGIHENHYVTGLLSYWDALKRRHPDMLLDACASGGRRLDLDVLKRCIPLIRSDTLFQPEQQQFHFMGASQYMPFHGTGTMFGPVTIAPDMDVSGWITELQGFRTYDFRSHMAPHITACWDLRDRTLPYGEMRKMLSQWRRIAPCYAGDYYPLTSQTLDAHAWAAWQFDRPAKNQGVVQVFRRPDSPYTKSVFPLLGLEPEAVYEVEDLDGIQSCRLTGNALMTQGLPVSLTEQPDSAVFLYKKQ